MAFDVNQLVKVLGKNADDFAKIGGKKSQGYKDALSSLTKEFNERGAKAASWKGIKDFSKLSESQQLSLVNKYNNRMDELHNLSSSDRKALLDKKLGRNADGTNKFTELNMQQKEATQEALLQAQKEKELRKINNRDDYRAATRQDTAPNPSKPTKEDIADTRRHRREEIRDSKTSSKKAKEKAKEDLRRNQKDSTAEEIDRSTSREDYKSQRSAERKQQREQRLAEERKGSTGEYVQSKGERVASKRMETQEEFNARKDKFKKELTERKVQRESGTPKTNEPIRDRQAEPLTAEERKARGLGGQSKAEYDIQLKAERRAEAEAQKAFNEAQEKIDKQNQGLIKRTLGSLSETGQKVISGVKDVVSGEARQRNADFASQYNEILRKNGSTDFIDLKGSKKLQGKYEGMSAQEIFDAQQQGVKMGGSGKKSNGVGTGANGPSTGNVTGEEEAAQGIAFGDSFKKHMSALEEWTFKDTSHTAFVIGAGVGTAILGAELLDEN